MYAYPELYGFHNEIKELDQARLDICSQEIVPKNGIPCDEDVCQLCVLIMEEMHLNFPNDPFEMCDLYINLRDEIRNAID